MCSSVCLCCCGVVLVFGFGVVICFGVGVCVVLCFVLWCCVVWCGLICCGGVWFGAVVVLLRGWWLWIGGLPLVLQSQYIPQGGCGNGCDVLWCVGVTLC